MQVALDVGKDNLDKKLLENLENKIENEALEISSIEHIILLAKPEKFLRRIMEEKSFSESLSDDNLNILKIFFKVEEELLNKESYEEGIKDILNFFQYHNLSSDSLDVLRQKFFFDVIVKVTKGISFSQPLYNKE